MVIAGVFAVLDWWAVAGSRRRLEHVAKPATMAALIGVAATIGDLSGTGRVLLVCGAVLGLLGDIALMGDSELAFMSGLVAFAVGHLAYAGSAFSIGFDVGWSLIGVVFMVVLLACRFATRTVPGAHRIGGAVLSGAVVFYAVVISAMVVGAWGTAIVLAGVGACAFAISDWVLGHQRFVGPLPGGRLAVMIPYHVGQAMLIVGLAGG